MKHAFDIVIIGAGSAGVPLAARLSEDPRRSVLLLEAGPRFAGIDRLPPELRFSGVLRAMMPGHPNNWNFTAKLGETQVQPLPRGRVVGGSSALNGTLFTRGIPADFQNWAKEGNTEWSYDRVLPYFRMLESDHDIQDACHGTAGPVPVHRATGGELVPVDRAFIAACRQLGFPYDPDMNGPESIGVGLLPTNSSGGVRMNSAMAYLDPAAGRNNLQVWPDTQALRILFEGKRAIGIEVLANGSVQRIFAGEVVLSAGAVKSPHLLMVSGIGPSNELERQGIAILHDLPQVGRQFTDHCSVSLPFRMPKRNNPALNPETNAWAHAALHFTSAASDEPSDLMLIQSVIPTTRSVLHGLPLLDYASTFRQMFGSMSPRKVLDHVRFGWDQAINCIMLRDDSRGEIRLTSADPTAKPELIYHYLQTDRDRARMREAIRTAAQLVESDPYRELGAKRAILSDREIGDDALLDQHLKRHMGTAIHMASTCRMGADAGNSVVDQYCRVHGIAGLRVVDTSIMPQVVRRCPAATAIMLGERAAAFFN